jgi:hypothetical protein
VTVAAAKVVLVKTSVMEVTPGRAFAVNPVTDPAGLQEEVQVKSVPETLEVSVIEVLVAEQMVFAAGLFETSGVGLTVTM